MKKLLLLIVSLIVFFCSFGQINSSDTVVVEGDSVVYSTLKDKLVVIDKTLPKKDLLENVIMSLIIGIVAGTIAASIFYYLTMMIKPKIRIADVVVKEKFIDESGKEGIIYRMKFINFTKANIEDISVDLFLMKEYYQGKNGKNYEAQRIKLKTESFKFLHGLKEKSELIHNNCVQLGTFEDLESKWEGKHDRLQLQIVAYHSKSGSRKVFKQEFKPPDVCIKEGMFDSGHSFEILPQKN